MDHFAGLDVSVKETSGCIVDDTGRLVREVKVVSEPETLLAALNRCDIKVQRRKHTQILCCHRDGAFHV
jgi:transposase